MDRLFLLEIITINLLMHPKIRFLVAEKSLKRPIIGFLAKGAGAVAVARRQDKAYRGLGCIEWKHDDRIVRGHQTRFSLDVHVGDQIQLVDETVLGTVDKIISDIEILLTKTPSSIKKNTTSEASKLSTLPTTEFQQTETSLATVQTSLSENSKNEENGESDKSIDVVQEKPDIKAIFDLSLEKKKFKQNTLEKTNESNSENDVLVSREVDIDSSEMLTSLSTSCYDSTNELVPFVVIPRLDQTDVYEAVCDALLSGDSIGIFPEGGSHDRLNLLPLKPGGAIMGLMASLHGAADVMIVPIGLTYYQAHKILSRATVQVGTPLRVTENLTELYRVDPRSAVSRLMAMIEESLKGCIISAPNYKALTAVRICVTLYPPESMFISSTVYYILYRQFSVLFAKNPSSPLLIRFTQNLDNYTSLLSRYGIADHEVQQLKQATESAILSFIELCFIFIVSLIVGLVPAVLWGPVRFASSYLAEQHRKKALAASKVKVTGRDVVASYKILTLMVLLPSANLLYSLIFALCYCSTYTGYLYCILSGLIFLPCLYYYSIRYFAKIPVLIRKFTFILLVVICKLNAWRDNEKEIIASRMQMQLDVRRLVQLLGPKTGDNFMNQMESCVPSVVCNADSNRIRRKLEAGDFIPLGTRFVSEGWEEIL
ncbi:uncharacterized protein LOC128883164 isoform X2 [Hylaeus volcanicus]|uniref:uncharacterized protein LOC128883164 isoform X2 n=1 Tax=Hylaeus volcanicus TaxID=313075 RepID=UPI0023B83E4A|nr:uncharacterized protein LOC128883164 isoform X2 [Hylaeus volcanicus]